MSAQQNFDDACGGIGMQCLRKFSVCTSVTGNIYLFIYVSVYINIFEIHDLC